MPADSSTWMSVDDFLRHEDNDSQTLDCFRRTKWPELCQFASKCNDDLKCVALDRVAFGLNNLVRLIEFSDHTRWAARVHIKRKAPLQVVQAKMENEVATMHFIKERSDLPVSRVFAHEINEINAVGVPFMLIEVLPGTVAMCAREVHRGVIPLKHRETFYRSVAKCHVQLTSLRLPQIGTIVRNDRGEYESGPLPGIGGPFDTAAAFFEAWADSVKFKLDHADIRNMLRTDPALAERMVTIIDDFPSRIKAMAGRLSSHNNGPFPLDHDDFLHSNIMVREDNFNVTGIIDWEGACSVPWELIAFPEFLQAMPTSFDLPRNYDQHGQPLDEEVRETWRERRDYVEMVKAAELDGNDTLLSACLGSKESQTLAYSYGAYTCIGKLGFYDRVADELEEGLYYRGQDGGLFAG